MWPVTEGFRHLDQADDVPLVDPDPVLLPENDAHRRDLFGHAVAQGARAVRHLAADQDQVGVLAPGGEHAMSLGGEGLDQAGQERSQCSARRGDRTENAHSARPPPRQPGDVADSCEGHDGVPFSP